MRGAGGGGLLAVYDDMMIYIFVCVCVPDTLQEKYGYPKLSGLEKLGINSQKLP